MYDGAPDYPTADRLWRILDDTASPTFGVSPTAIRVLMHTSDPTRIPMDALRLLGSTGEPWDETSYLWFFENVGRRRIPILNISGGTEIIGCFLYPLADSAAEALHAGRARPRHGRRDSRRRGQPRPAGQSPATWPAPNRCHR